MRRSVIWYAALALVVLALIFALAAVTVLGWQTGITPPGNPGG